MPYEYTKLKEADVAKKVSHHYELSKRYTDIIHKRMNEQEELYRTYINANDYPHTARVFDPRVFRVIETVTPRLVANEPEGSFYPTEEGDIETAYILSALTKYDWRRAKMFPKLVTFVKGMLIFGTAFGRVYWDYRTKTRSRMIPKEIGGKLMWSPSNTEKIEITEFDGPNFENLNIYDCFPDPNATNMDDMRYFIYRTFKTLKELENCTDTRGNPKYKNLDKLRLMIQQKKDQSGNKGGTSPTDLEYREHRRTMLGTQEFIGDDEYNPTLTILREFTPDGWCEVVKDYDVVIREVENPYFDGDLPIIYGVDYPYPGELFGMGEIEPIDRVQRAINAVLNQRLDNVQLVLRNMWKVRRNSGVDMSSLISAPGNIIQVDDMTALEPLSIPDVTGATFVQTMDYLTSSLQNGSGITDYTLGVNSGANTTNSTATGVRLIQQEANAQFKLKVQLFNHQVVSQIVNKWKNLRIQYTTEEQKLRIIGKQEVEELVEKTELSKRDMFGNDIVPGDFSSTAKLEIGKNGTFAFLHLLPDDIQPSVVGDYDFIPAITTEQLNDPMAQQEAFFAAVDRVTSQPFVEGLAQQQKMVNYDFLARKTFEKLGIGIEGKEVLMEMPQQPMEGQPPEQQGELTPEQMDEMMGPMTNPLDEEMPTAEPLANQDFSMEAMEENLGQGGNNVLGQ